MRSRFWLCFAMLLLGLGVTAAVAIAQRESRQEIKIGKSESPVALMFEREDTALNFAKLHHEELARLLKRLKTRDNRAYWRAIRRLYQDSERLARTEKRATPERYKLALALWKLDSRIRLLAARVLLAKQPKPKLKTRLNDALLERVDLRIRMMEMDRQRLLGRIQKIDANIAGLQADRAAAAKKELQRVKRSLGIRKSRKTRKKIRKKMGRSDPKRKRAKKGSGNSGGKGTLKTN